MKFKELKGTDIGADIELVKQEIQKDSSLVFIYSGQGTLYDYITDLYNDGDGLDSEMLYILKVCYEKSGLGFEYSAEGGQDKCQLTSMSALLAKLDRNTACRIVVEKDDPVELAFIVQQLIYIDYPLEKVDILRRKEEKDAAKTSRFMNKVQELQDGCASAVAGLEKLKQSVEKDNDAEKQKRLKDIEDALQSCRDIENYIRQAIDVELKFAVAASKKAGKSVIVNCFLGEEIAPTSTELATPNNCIYKKSADKQYHLQLEDGSARQDFADCASIKKAINKCFRDAQNDDTKGFALPDMDISYVTDKNNFSSYTIYDTAGPDAAGTKHSEAAERAMKKCDVAVFAIDYAKYLTKSEEEYLRQVKQQFMAQEKFHSLVFALNKIDVRYTDVKSPKSFVMSVDFLKTRMSKIDPAYKDCIVFPTCSLEYFSAIEAEKAGVNELNAGNNLKVDDLKRVKLAHKKDAPSLAWLHTHAENLENYHGIENISYDVFKKDSGMPALMSYVSYVARSKARDEIVNSITFKIDAQQRNIRHVLDNISNIQALIDADDEKIAKIKNILEDYEKAVEDVLPPVFKKEELERLDLDERLHERPDDRSLLSQEKGDYEKIIERRKENVEPYSRPKDIAEKMYELAVEDIWEKITSEHLLSGHDIDNLFTNSDFVALADKVSKRRISEAANGTYQMLDKLRKEVKIIVEKRMKDLKKQSDICRHKLEKENVNLTLPDVPNFEFSAPISAPDEVIVGGSDKDLKIYDSLSKLFKTKKLNWHNIKTLLRRPFGATGKDYEFYLKNKDSGDTERKFRTLCKEELEETFKNQVYESEISGQLKTAIEKIVVDNYMRTSVNEIAAMFQAVNKSYKAYSDGFKQAIDDRKVYQENNNLRERRQVVISKITTFTRGFMETWNSIVSGVITDESRPAENNSASK
ncbi:MAG: dynamin family protein [bacterium]|nr:dynamin family protein [bacterium]